jgi:hypothetical protein
MSYYTDTSINDLINECSYPFETRKYIFTIVTGLISTCKTAKIFKFTKKTKIGNELIILVKYDIPTLFKSRSYDIPILIYLGASFPNEPPEIYVNLNPSIGINVNNRDIDPANGRILIRGLLTWNKNSYLGDVITEVNKSFNTNFPIYQVKSTNVSTTSEHSSTNQNTTVISPNNSQDLSQFNSSSGQSSPFTVRPSQTDIRNMVNVNPNQVAYSEPIENVTRYILVDEIKKGVLHSIVDEFKKLKQQEEKLKNFKNEYMALYNNLFKRVSQRNEIVTYLQNNLKVLSQSLVDTNNYLAENSNKQLNTSNFDDYFIIDKTDKQIVHLITLEATIDDFTTVIKKSYEKNATSFSEVVKTIRGLSREAFKIKFCKEKLIKYKK